jgi:exodeoxyribonuclease VII large subunit
LQNAGGQMLARKQQALGASVGKLEALSPLAVLQRGYAVAADGSGEVATSASAFEVGQPITVRFADGAVHATVDSIEKEQLWKKK